MFVLSYIRKWAIPSSKEPKHVYKLEKRNRTHRLHRPVALFNIT